MLKVDLNSFFSKEELASFRKEATMIIGCSTDGRIENESEQVNAKIKQLKEDAFKKWEKEFS